MKQLLFAISVVCAFASCQKDNVLNVPEFVEIGDDRAYIFVEVIVEDIDADINGCLNGSNDNYVEEAMVSLFYMEEEGPISREAVLVAQTDQNGCTVFDDLPQGNYIVKVVSKHGQKQQTVIASHGKMTRVFIRF